LTILQRVFISFSKKESKDLCIGKIAQLHSIKHVQYSQTSLKRWENEKMGVFCKKMLKNVKNSVKSKKSKMIIVHNSLTYYIIYQSYYFLSIFIVSICLLT